MKVIFIQNFPPKIKEGGVKEVEPGYARNFLFPKKIAIPFSPVAWRVWQEREHRNIARSEKLERERKERFRQLENKSLSFSMKAADDGTLFGSITKREIVNVLKNEWKIDISEDHLLLEHPIKTIGKHTIFLQFSKEEKMPIPIEVVKNS